MPNAQKRTGCRLNPIKYQIYKFRLNLHVIISYVSTKMFIKTLTVLFILLVLSNAEVVVLDDSNYTSFIQQHPYVFVKFYAPWCGHCKAIAEDYIQLAQASAGKDYVIAEVDATVAENISSQLGVQGYPSLKFIVEGNAIDYAGDRSASFMQKWIQNLIEGEIKHITEDDLIALLGTQDLVVVRGASKEQLKSLAFSQQLSGITFYAFQGDKYSLGIHLKNGKSAQYIGDLDIKEITEWVTELTIGHLVALSSQNLVKKVFENEGKLPVLLLLKNPDFTAQALQTLLAFCESKEKELKCAYADESHQIYGGIAHFFKKEENNKSDLAFLDFGIKNGYKFDLTQLSQQGLAQFLQDISQGKVQKFHDEQKLKKEKEIKYTNVVILNNQNYNSTLQKNQYVFVEYYSATCGHCVKFAPQYEQLATSLKQQNSSYLIAAVDLSQEKEIKDQVHVKGYPTFKFYVRGQQIEYRGTRDAENMVNFMNEASKSQLKTVSSIEESQKPAIAVYGVDQSSPFHLLPFIYNRFPVYHILGQSEFKVQIHWKAVIAYAGEKDLQAVAQWLDRNTEPVIVSVVEQPQPNKLTKALETNVPLLVIVNRDNSETFKTAYAFMNGFCESQTEFLCGIANKGEGGYQNFNDWIGDTYNENSALLYLNTEKFEKYLYEGDLARLNAEAVNQFVSAIKEGKIAPYKGKVNIEIDATNAGKEAAAKQATEGEAETATETQTQEEAAAETGEQNASESEEDEVLIQAGKVVVQSQEL